MNLPHSSKAAVISQPMYFPWVGLLEQVRLADVFVHLEDVQFARGFYNRVQVKSTNGIRWITIPLRDQHRGQKINEVEIDERWDWRSQHRDILRQAYLKSRYRDEMLKIADEVFSKPARNLADIARDSTYALARYFNISQSKEFIKSSNMCVAGSSSQRLLDICKALEADVYITGHGARNYLDHQLFERSKIRVEYMQYRMAQYPQQHGEFVPFVSGLDLVANCGQAGSDLICSHSIYWKDFINDAQ